MANAAFFWINHLIGADLQASAETLDGVVGELVQPVLSVKWRALSSSAFFTGDCGAARPFKFLALLGVSLSDAGTIRLRLANVADFSVVVHDSGVIPASPRVTLDGRRQCLLILPAVVNARYIKVDLVDAGAGFIDVGYAWAGPWWQPERNFSWNFRNGTLSASTKERSLAMNLYATKRPKARTKVFDLAFMRPEEEAAQGVEITDRAGDHSPFGMVPDPLSVDATREMLVGILTDMTETTGVAVRIRARPFELVEII